MTTEQVPMTKSKRAALHLERELEREGEEACRAQEEEAAEAGARSDKTARQNDLWDAGAEARYQDELRRMARDDEARAS